jgi:signal peptidase II
VSRRKPAETTPQPEPAKPDAAHPAPAPRKPEPPRPLSAARAPAAWALLIAVTAAGAAIDLASKHLAFTRIADAPVAVKREHVLAFPPDQLNAALIPPHEPVVVLPYVLELKLLLNPGAVFGFGPGQRWFFVVFTLFAIAAAIYMFAKWTTPRDRLTHVALGLVLSGGLGNLYDRLVHGCVRDFLHPLPNVPMPFGLAWPSGETDLWPWVSNIADAFLLVGIGILMVKLWRSGDEPKPADSSQVDEAETPA